MAKVIKITRKDDRLDEIFERLWQMLWQDYDNFGNSPFLLWDGSPDPEAVALGKELHRLAGLDYMIEVFFCLCAQKDFELPRYMDDLKEAWSGIGKWADYDVLGYFYRAVRRGDFESWNVRIPDHYWHDPIEFIGPKNVDATKNPVYKQKK